MKKPLAIIFIESSWNVVQGKKKKKSNEGRMEFCKLGLFGFTSPECVVIFLQESGTRNFHIQAAS